MAGGAVSRVIGSTPIRAATFHRAEGQVALAAFDAAHVGAVDAEDMSAKASCEAGLAVGAQVAAEYELEVAFPSAQTLPFPPYLRRLQTYK